MGTERGVGANHVSFPYQDLPLENHLGVDPDHQVSEYGIQNGWN